MTVFAAIEDDGGRCGTASARSSRQFEEMEVERCTHGGGEGRCGVVSTMLAA